MDFKLKNIDNRYISLSDFPEAKGFIIVFTCNHCPYANAYEQRIINLHNKFAPVGFPVIAINSNDPAQYPMDSFENMKEKAQQLNFPFVYLFDETQEVAKRYGAERTPHVFIISRKPENQLKVEYQGAIDDNWKNANEVMEKYVDKAMDFILKGLTPPTKETPPVGCTIKWKKEEVGY